MPPILEEVTKVEDFDEIMPALFTAFGEPYNSFRQWFIPVHTTTEDAVEGSKQRNMKIWKEQEGIHWLKVTDIETGKIIGAAEWAIRLNIAGTPGEPQQPIIANWHLPDTEEKDFAGQFITELKGFMKKHMTRPHIELQQIFVSPQYRGRGFSKPLMDWGIKKADELGLESCIAAVHFAVPIYERFGYGNAATLVPDMTRENPSQKWKDYAAEDLRVFLMWRPAGHGYTKEDEKSRWADI